MAEALRKAYSRHAWRLPRPVTDYTRECGGSIGGLKKLQE